MREAKAWMVAAVLVAGAAGCRSPMGFANARPTATGQAVSVHTLSSRFSPGALIVDPGRAVTVSVHNSSLTSHTFTIGEPSVDVVVGPGEAKDVTFVPARSTTFICRFHEADGMKGALCLRDESCTTQRLP